MTRIERLQGAYTKDMRLIEIGASYSPIIPKADGWNTTVVDHADQTELRAKYHGLAEFSIDNIEYVDYVWRDGPLVEAIPAAYHGTFDGLIASHVGEHMPDLIGFFLAAGRLLKPSGVLTLALPDKRLCFDFFRPLSTTGDVLNAQGRTRHSRGTLFDHAAYMADRGGIGAWMKGGPIVPFTLCHDLSAAPTAIREDSEEYVDAHVWRFTPASFQLLVLELNVLGTIPWMIDRIEPAGGVEFYVWLKQGKLDLSPENVAEQRLTLLQEIVMEAKEQIAQLEVPAAPVPEPFVILMEPELLEPEPEPEPEPSMPTISAIIPLYNGGRYIEIALRSILAQTVPAHEIIVVDDGSTDSGPLVVRALAAQYPIVLLTKANGGQSSARNFGVVHSTGTLIAFLDQDDVWYPTHLEKLREPYLDPPPGADLGWVYSDLDEIDTDGLMIHHAFLSSLPTEHPKRNLFACLREDMFVLPSASLISRKAFDGIGGFDERLSGYEDDDLFLRLFRANYANVFLKMSLSQWRIYPESYSYTYRMRRSRAIYARKLLNTYADDPKRARFIHRDLILPRFYGHAVVEYRNALIAGDADRIRETRDELVFFVDQIPAKKRTMGRLLVMVRSQKAAQLAFALRGVARPIYRRLF